MNERELRKAVTKLAHANPGPVRDALLPLLTEQANDTRKSGALSGRLTSIVETLSNDLDDSVRDVKDSLKEASKALTQLRKGLRSGNEKTIQEGLDGLTSFAKKAQDAGAKMLKDIKTSGL